MSVAYEFVQLTDRKAKVHAHSKHGVYFPESSIMMFRLFQVKSAQPGLITPRGLMTRQESCHGGICGAKAVPIVRLNHPLTTFSKYVSLY